MRKKFLLVSLAAFAVLALFLAACGDDDSGGTATATRTGGASTTASATGTGGAGAPLEITITATNFKFDKTTISAKKGQVVDVKFVNDGSVEHSFTVGSSDVAEAEGGSDKSGSFTASDSTTEFHCKYHPSQMKGTITLS